MIPASLLVIIVVRDCDQRHTQGGDVDGCMHKQRGLSEKRDARDGLIEWIDRTTY